MDLSPQENAVSLLNEQSSHRADIYATADQSQYQFVTEDYRIKKKAQSEDSNTHACQSDMHQHTHRVEAIDYKRVADRWTLGPQSLLMRGGRSGQ
jgi:hypothetical protein